MRLLFALLVFAAALECHAANAFKCTNEKGHITYQQIACPAGHAERRFVFVPPPKADALPVAAAEPKPKPPRPPRRARRVSEDAGPASYECRVTNGEVYYQHAPCPTTVPGEGAAPRRGKRGASSALSVSGRALSRRDACKRIRAAGATSRAGHDRDEDVSTYEKNLGRDPCR